MPEDQEKIITCPNCQTEFDGSELPEEYEIDCPSCDHPLSSSGQQNIIKASKPGGTETVKAQKTASNKNQAARKKKKPITTTTIANSEEPPEKPKTKKKKKSGGAASSALFLLIILGLIGGGIYYTLDDIKAALQGPKHVNSAKIITKKNAYIVKEKEKVDNSPKKLNKEELQKLREKLMPVDLDLYIMDEDIELYLNQFEGKEQQLEEQKLDWAASFRSEIVYLLQKEPFYGYIFLKEGGPIGGWISVSDDQELFLKTKKEIRPLAWNDLQFKQWHEIITYFATKEANHFRLDGVNKNTFLTISDLYKKLALFYHWYNLNDQAEQVFEKARLLDSELIVLNEYLTTLQTYEVVEVQGDDIVYMEAKNDKLKDTKL